LQSNSDSEVEDLLDPKDELKKKIVNLAGTIRKWNEETVNVRKSVREQLKAITELGLNKYKMQRTELRKLTEEIFRYHGISESWLRKLLPEELKDTSKTRLSYLQKQEIEKERQRLVQQYPELRERSEMKERPLPVVESTTDQSSISQELQSQEYESFQLPSHQTSVLAQDNNKDKIEKLEKEVHRLSEAFVAKAYLQIMDRAIPLIVQVDPVKKVITSIQFDEATDI
jgi:hypothetical protein